MWPMKLPSPEVNGGAEISSTVSANIASFFQVAVQEGENSATITAGGASYTTTFTANTGACTALALNLTSGWESIGAPMISPVIRVCSTASV